MKSKFLFLITAIVGQLVLLTNTVIACPLCQAGATKQTQSAYLSTTVLLISVPIISGLFLFFWLRAKYSKGE